MATKKPYCTYCITEQQARDEGEDCEVCDDPDKCGGHKLRKAVVLVPRYDESAEDIAGEQPVYYPLCKEHEEAWFEDNDSRDFPPVNL